MLIDPRRVEISDYFKTFRKDFKLAGFITITIPDAEPDWKTWDKPPHNAFVNICSKAKVDGVEFWVLPVFFNDQQTDFWLDGDKWQKKFVQDRTESFMVNSSKPAIAFFKGNDDWSWALRFETYHERDRMVSHFGEDLGFLHDDLIGQN